MFLEVDLEYPKEIHEQHGDFPMAPEKCNVTYNELSPLNQSLYREMKNNEFFTNYAEEKLIPTLHNRKNYILHIKSLIFYLSHGLILKKIHKIVSFKQKTVSERIHYNLDSATCYMCCQKFDLFCECF